MREILFRGKRVIDGKWVESCCPLGEMHSGTVTYDFDSNTVCQYTGLTDKNGRKIFEGDIVKLILPSGEIRHFKVSIKSVVRKVLCHPDFDDQFSKVEITGVVFEWNGYELFPCVDTYDTPDYKMMEVIGNIFDNPELIGDQP